MMPISCDLRAVLGGRHVAAAVLDHHLHHERHVVGQRGDDVVLVDHLDLVVGMTSAPVTDPLVCFSMRTTRVCRCDS